MHGCPGGPGGPGGKTLCRSKTTLGRLAGSGAGFWTTFGLIRTSRLSKKWPFGGLNAFFGLFVKQSSSSFIKFGFLKTGSWIMYLCGGGGGGGRKDPDAGGYGVGNLGAPQNGTA